MKLTCNNVGQNIKKNDKFYRTSNKKKLIIVIFFLPLNRLIYENISEKNKKNIRLKNQVGIDAPNYKY